MIMKKLEEAISAFVDSMHERTFRLLIGYGIPVHLKEDMKKLLRGIEDAYAFAFKAGAEWHERQSKHGERDKMFVASLIGADKARPKWISVKDGLPQIETEVLVLNDGNVQIARYCKQFMSNRRYWNIDDALVTHWMPIPELPKGGLNECR